ncbi:hypothetical protein D3C85_1556460 [compost metagenome]
MTVFAHQIPQPYHLAAVIHAVMIQILENFAPLQLGFIRNIRQLLPQTLFNHPHKYTVGDLVLALFVAPRKLFQIAAHSPRHLFYFSSR